MPREALALQQESARTEADECYIDCTEKLGPPARELMEKFHPHLLKFRIKFVFDLAEECPTRGTGKNKQRVLAKVSKTSGLLRMYSDSDALIVVHAGTWDTLLPSKRAALIDHELCHLVLNEEGTALTMRPHDTEEFREIIERHGLWKDDLVATGKSVQLALKLWPDTDGARPDERVEVEFPEDRKPAPPSEPAAP